MCGFVAQFASVYRLLKPKTLVFELEHPERLSAYQCSLLNELISQIPAPGGPGNVPPDHQIAAMSYHRINKKRGTIMKQHEKTCKFKISEIGTVGEALLAISSVVGGTNVSCLK